MAGDEIWSPGRSIKFDEAISLEVANVKGVTEAILGMRKIEVKGLLDAYNQA